MNNLWKRNCNQAEEALTGGEQAGLRRNTSHLTLLTLTFLLISSYTALRLSHQIPMVYLSFYK